MIIAHLLIGIILSKFYGNYFLFIFGSMFLDIDHLYIILRNKIFSVKKLIKTIKYEKEFGLQYKTAFVHSLLGLVIFSLIIYAIVGIKAVNFSIAYFLHLLIDWADIDVKYFLYPLKIKFKGFLPIWSKSEKIFTIILLLTILILYLT